MRTKSVNTIPIVEQLRSGLPHRPLGQWASERRRAARNSALAEVASHRQRAGLDHGFEDPWHMHRHSDIRTTMNLYTQDDRDEKQAAQGAFLSAVGLGSRLVQ